MKLRTGQSLEPGNRCSASLRKTKENVIEHDSFATEYKFRLPKGKERLSSIKGCIFTFLLVSSLLFYGSMQSIKLLTFDETDIMISSRDSYFEADEVYSKNLFYAFGLTSYDSNPEPIEDSTIGTL